MINKEWLFNFVEDMQISLSGLLLRLDDDQNSNEILDDLLLIINRFGYMATETKEGDNND